MNKKISLLLVSGCLTAALLQGCAGVLVAGGAAGASMAGDRRTAGTFVEDQSIELKAINSIFGDQELADKARINATAYNGLLLLTGQTPTEELRDRAVNRVTNIEKVRRVHNEITIGEPIAFQVNTKDSWITTRVKSTLLGTKNIAANHIKVVTDNGAAYLMGLVTHTEADTASDIASNIDGVQRVIKIFEYID